MIYRFLKERKFIRKNFFFLKIYNFLYSIFILFLKKKRIVNFYNVKVAINLNDYLCSRRVFFFKSFNKKVEDYILKNIKANQIVVDVGANIGLLSILMSKIVGPNGMVVAFEPDKRNIDLIKESIKFNNISNIQLHECLLTNQISKKKFFIDKKYFGSNSILENVLPSNNYKEINLESKTLDSIVLNSYKKIDFIKCNIDGSEYYFIEGAKKTIEKYKPKILIEYCYLRLINFEGFNNDNFLNYFRRLGYSISPLGYKKKMFSNSDLSELSIKHEKERMGTLHLILD